MLVFYSQLGARQLPELQSKYFQETNKTTICFQQHLKKRLAVTGNLQRLGTDEHTLSTLRSGNSN